jgi:RNA polymerase sigma-70 factor (ECF subfamily)
METLPFCAPVVPLPEKPERDHSADAALIDRINVGDSDAFNLLYYRHRDWIFRMAWRITGSPHHADDVIQEVFRYFLGKFPGFKLTCALRSFLYPVVRNISLNLLKKARRYDGGPAAEAHLSSLPAEAPGASSDEITALVGHLGNDHQEVLMLRFAEGMTVPEIAELTGVPLGTVKSRLHHALAALRGNPEFLKRHGLNERSAPAKC